MKIHIVKSPFMSRDSQFEKDKQTLCIGLDVRALKAVLTFRCYLGKNRKASYTINSIQALELATQYKSFWTNKKGRQVAILPIKDFKMEVHKFNKEAYEKKEIERARVIQQTLL